MRLKFKKFFLFKIIKSVRFLSITLIAGVILCGCSDNKKDIRSSSVSEPLTKSKVITLSVESKFMGRKMPCMIYLPKGYGNGKEYPVWYALHGHSSNESMWLDEGIGNTADKMIDNGEIEPIIMVFPYVKDATVKEIMADMEDDGKFDERNIDKYLSKELIPYIDSHYYTVTSPKGRYIGGLSMGGMIALRVAFHHTDLFSKVGGYTAAVLSNDYSDKQLEEWLYPNDNFDHIKNINEFDKKKGFDKLNIYIEAGNADDPFSEGLQSLYKALQIRGINVNFRLYNGGHSLQTDSLGDYLKFYAKKD